MLLIGASEIRRLLPLAEAIPLMHRAFSLISAGPASFTPRQVLTLRNGTGLLMGAAAAGIGIIGKLVSVMPGNRQQGLPGSVGMLLLMDDATGEPLAMLDGTQLTARRTAAANGLAIDLLARSDARRGLLVGCGTQAAAQLQAMDAVRDLEEISVLGRNLREAERFARAHQDKVGATLRPHDDPAAVLEAADLVVAATNSLEPVIPGDGLPPGCHVSGIGSFRPDMREFDNELVSRCAIFVESRAIALEEAGELIAARDAGCTVPGHWVEVGEVLGGTAAGRTGPEQCTFFKSVGHAAYDLVAARAVYEAAGEQGVGTPWQNR